MYVAENHADEPCDHRVRPDLRVFSRNNVCVATLAVVLFALLNAEREEKMYSLKFLEGQLYRPATALYVVCFGLWCFANERYLLRRPTGDTFRGLSLGMMGGSVAGNMVRSPIFSVNHMIVAPCLRPPPLVANFLCRY